MRFLRTDMVRYVSFLSMALGVALPAVAISDEPAKAESSPITMATLLDRARLEDLIVDFYAQFERTTYDLAPYFTEDGVIDVDGLVVRGRKGIADLYRGVAGAAQSGKTHTLLTNRKVVVKGESATIDCVWTEIVSETHKALPRFVEQGRDHDELVKREGRWFIKKRVITTDGGLPPSLEKSYVER